MKSEIVPIIMCCGICLKCGILPVTHICLQLLLHDWGFVLLRMLYLYDGLNVVLEHLMRAHTLGRIDAATGTEAATLEVGEPIADLLRRRQYVQ